MLQLIAEPQRLKMLCLLAEEAQAHPQGLCVSEFVDRFQKPQNLISHHLGMLKRAQLVLTTREGKHIRYRLNTQVYGQVQESLQLLFRLK